MKKKKRGPVCIVPSSVEEVKKLEEWIETDNDYEPTEKEKEELYKKILERVKGLEI